MAYLIAKYIINYCCDENISVSNLKLQKLLYFAWIRYYKETQKELFDNDICAWQLGPVVPDVYSEYCAFGGKPIRRKYEDVDLPDEIKHILDKFLEEKAPISASRLYVPADFDTIEKAFSGVKTAEKGIK